MRTKREEERPIESGRGRGRGRQTWFSEHTACCRRVVAQGGLEGRREREEEGPIKCGRRRAGETLLGPGTAPALVARRLGRRHRPVCCALVLFRPSTLIASTQTCTQL